ncbi:methyltransferase-domain-containing protein [Hygrophoropsis aurantiaca]|uniref:Methyltransferase-domain-containing protein n=1 Tax=Hygrophoropsis aurantiaca TaxID=72124 RepID=A0ACB8ASB6_9AGAM|nr:methyltransferase-domain-containing protein [Hygrophoropsis aurantiaca]
MALFEVPGWSVPSAPVSEISQSTSKKRKRPVPQDGDKLQSAEVNLDKLMRKLAGDSKDLDKQAPKKKKTKHEKPHVENPQGNGHKSVVVNAKKGKGKTSLNSNAHTPETPDKKSDAPAKKKKDGKSRAVNHASKDGSTAEPPVASTSQSGLTSLQKGMKDSLDGAKFRWINELLYKSDSTEAVKMMKDDPAVFDEYHSGFRHQVQLWPSNPVAHYITELSSYPKKTVIADLGCGDAALARGLQAKKINVLSFDLISDNAFVVEADICSKIPLPGSEPSSGPKSEGEAQVIDVVVCALSLMGTNWPNCIREAWRILKSGGELKIAEVASRFTDTDEFVSLIGSIGFKLHNKDDRNSHFTLFDFKKVPQVAKTEKEWSKLMSKGSLLKPCEYKRR